MVSRKELAEYGGRARADLRRLARDFGLRYSGRNLNLLLITRREGLMRNYLSWAPHFNQYGKTPGERVKNIDGFFKSSAFRRGRWAGTVVTRKGLESELRLTPKIKEKAIREKYQELYSRFTKAVKSADYLTLLLECKGKRRQHTILTKILRHEWMHILLEENGIHFADLGGDSWLVDDGLVTYMEAYLDGRVSRLRQRLKATKNLWGRKYLSNALKWKKLLEGRETPGERKKAVMDYYTGLK